MKGKIVLNLGEKEDTVGLTYVAFSKAIKLQNIGIDGGFNRARIMEVISSKDSLKRRLEADARLTKLSEETIEKLRNYRGI